MLRLRASLGYSISSGHHLRLSSSFKCRVAHLNNKAWVEHSWICTVTDLALGPVVRKVVVAACEASVDPWAATVRPSISSLVSGSIVLSVGGAPLASKHAHALLFDGAPQGDQDVIMAASPDDSTKSIKYGILRRWRGRASDTSSYTVVSSPWSVDSGRYSISQK